MGQEVTDMKQTCSKNLTKHLTLLKQECNKLITLHKNGYTIPTELYSHYVKHKRYVTELLHIEKMKSYDKILLKAR